MPPATTAITRERIAQVLREIALLLELQGENPFKIRAYKNGAEVVESFSGDIVEKAANEDLKGIKGIGDALQQKLHELATTGELEFYNKLRGEFPESIFELFEIQGLGPKKVKALYSSLGIDSIDKLVSACEDGSIEVLSGFGKKTCEKILESIEYRKKYAERFRLDEVTPVVEEITEFLLNLPNAGQVEIAGSYRRGKETVGDLDFIVVSKKGAKLCEQFCAAPFAESTIVCGETKASVRLHEPAGLQCDLRVVSAEQLPFTLNYFTGSKEHNVAMRGRALKKGYSLNEYDFSPEKDSPAPPSIKSEKELYAFLDLEYIDPALREGQGEIEASEKDDLPDLIQLGQLKGTFHNHTTASDGKNSLQEMAEAAAELGLDYLGIADHSKSSFQANGLDEDQLRGQIEEIRSLNKKLTKNGGATLLAGSEVDILKDGSLDFDDELLAELDYCVASVHSSFTQSESAMTKRLIKAVQNPHVTMLGHLTGRLLLKREPYAVNIPAVIDACAETGTIIELNANPWRLDMDWRWWKYAAEKGVKCAINPDAHHVSHLSFLRFGVAIARKGWLQKEQVINTMSLKEIRQLFAAS